MKNDVPEKPKGSGAGKHGNKKPTTLKYVEYMETILDHKEDTGKWGGKKLKLLWDNGYYRISRSPVLTKCT